MTNRKKYSFLFLIVCLFMLGTITVYANPYENVYQDADGDGYYEVPCTKVAWQKAYDVCGVALPGWSHAKTWLASAQAAGYSTGNEARVNSIAVFNTGEFGHVSFVLAVNGNTMTVYEGGRYDLDTTSSHGVGTSYPSCIVGQGGLIGFIYLGNNSGGGSLHPDGSASGASGFADGVYYIASKLNINMRLDVAYGGTSNGTNLWLYESNNSTTQQFRVTKQSDGKTYRLQAVCNDLYIDNGGSSDIDFNTHMWEWASTGAQMWYIIDAGNGWYTFVNHDSGLVLDVQNGNTANGTNIRQHTSNGTDSQKFRFIPVGNANISDGVYNIESKLNTNLRLDVAYGGSSNGANLWLYQSNHSSAQQFRVTKQSDGKTYRLQAVCNDLYIDNGGSSDIDFNTHMWEWASTGAQMWYVIDAGDGWYSIVNHDSGLALDVENGNASSGTNIRQHTYNGSNAQKWRFVQAHTLIRVASKVATTTSEGNIEYWKCNSCGKLFKDSEGETEISHAQTVISKLPANENNDDTSGGNQTGGGNQSGGSNQSNNSGQAGGNNQQANGSQTATNATSTNKKEPITIKKTPTSVKAKAKKGKVTVSWKKIKKTKKTKALLKQIKGIQIQYSTDPKFEDKVATKIKKVGKKKTKVTLKLKRKTKYYIRVRYVGADGVSKWSKVKKVKTK